MAININPGQPLRHIATYNNSGTFTPPPGTNLAFISVVGAGSGGYGGARYGTGAGFAGGVAGAYVQVVGGSPHIVTVGAGGTGGLGNNGGNAMPAPGTGGTTSFDGRLTITGAGANVGARYSAGNAIAGASSGITALTTINPGANTLISTGTITSQNSGGSAGGAGGATTGSSPRYQQSQTTGHSGTPGSVHVYV